MAEQKGPQQLALEAEFPRAQLDTVPKEGRNLTYVPVGEVIQRLNDVLGVCGWDWKLERMWRDEGDKEWVIAYGNLTATVDGKTSTKSGSGGVKVKLTRKDSSIVDLGDEFKGAESDALKKAAQRFGVGLWLARSADARAYEAPRPVRDPEAEGWESKERAQEFTKSINAAVKAQSEDIQAAMRQFRDDNGIIWPPTFDGYETMRKHLDDLIKEAERPNLRDVPPKPTPPTPAELQAASDQVAGAFPGAEDVSLASLEKRQTILDHLARFGRNNERALVQAYRKYAKTKGYPTEAEKLEGMTDAQADEALDFIESL